MAALPSWGALAAAPAVVPMAVQLHQEPLQHHIMLSWTPASPTDKSILLANAQGRVLHEKGNPSDRDTLP